MISDIVRWLEPYPVLYRPARWVYRTAGGVAGRVRETRTQRRERIVAREFHRVYYDAHLTRSDVKYQWLGVPIQKLPMDLCILQEILWETRPEQIIECGVNFGGSTWFLATVCDAMNHGQILAVDISLASVWPQVPQHPRVEMVEMSSTSPEFVKLARERAAGKRTMVILDSDHRCQHVLDELRLHGSLVTPGCYLICEDSNMNGHPVLQSFGPGPYEALEQYLPEVPGMWTVDRNKERLLVTFNPSGYLRRNPT